MIFYNSAPLSDTDRRLVDTIQRLLSIRSLELRPALTEAASLVAEVLEADKVDVPLVVNGERRGMLAAASATPDCFSEADLHFLAAVSNWIGMMTHRAQEYERALAEAEQRGRRRASEELAHISPREREVAMLVAEGLTNGKIAHRLTLVEGTVANHVEHVLRKLKLRSRTQIAVWAVEHGLYRLGQEDIQDDTPPTPDAVRR